MPLDISSFFSSCSSLIVPGEYSEWSLYAGGSAGKGSACNVGDLGSILGGEDPLEKGKATHSSILAWRISRTIYNPWGCKELDMIERLSLFTLCRYLKKILPNYYPDYFGNKQLRACSDRVA